MGGHGKVAGMHHAKPASQDNQAPDLRQLSDNELMSVTSVYRTLLAKAPQGRLQLRVFTKMK